MTTPPAYSYDVALSLLDQDRALARRVVAELAPRLSCFLYSEQQREIAGRNGVEVFADLFKTRSRLNVVLYRAGWGERGFTSIERTAILDRCVQDGWRTVLLVMLERGEQPPQWWPRSEIYQSYGEFGLGETVGVIRARALEAGATLRAALSPAEFAAQRAEQVADEERRRDIMASRQALSFAEREVTAVLTAVQRELANAGARVPQEQLTLRVAQADRLRLFVQANRAGLTIAWQPHYTATLEGSALVVRFWRGLLPMPPEFIPPGRSPERISEVEYTLSLESGDRWLWSAGGPRRDTQDGANLATAIVRRLVELAFAPAPS